LNLCVPRVVPGPTTVDRAAGMALGVFMAAFAAGCSGGKGRAEKPRPVPVVAVVAARRDVPVEVRTIGSVEAYSTVSVKPQVGGIVTEVHFKEGSDVRQGDVLFTIDPRPYEAALAQAESNLARDRAQETNATAEARRTEALFAEGIASKEQHDAALASAEAFGAAVKADQAAVKTAELNLEYCRIQSPIDGRTGSLLVHGGNLVKAIDGGPLVVIDRVSPIFVSFTVAELVLPEIRRRATSGSLLVEAAPPEDKAKPSRGTLAFFDNEVDRSTGTIRLKATFPNLDRRLWPGQFVNVRLTLSMRRGALVVPKEALQTGQTGSFVYVVRQDQTVESRPVAIFDTGSEGNIVVEKGLEAGETVVTDGQLRLVPGTAVEIVKPGESNATPPPSRGSPS